MINVADGDDRVPLQVGQVHGGEPPEEDDGGELFEGEAVWAGNEVSGNAQVGVQADTVVADAIYVGWD